MSSPSGMLRFTGAAALAASALAWPVDLSAQTPLPGRIEIIALQSTTYTGEERDGEDDVGSQGLITRRCFELVALTLTLGMGAGNCGSRRWGERVHFATLGPGLPGCLLVCASIAFAKGMTELGYSPESVIESRCFSELAEVPDLRLSRALGVCRRHA